MEWLTEAVVIWAMVLVAGLIVFFSLLLVDHESKRCDNCREKLTRWERLNNEEKA